MCKTGKFFEASVACKFENKKNELYRSLIHERLLNQAGGSILLETENEEESMWEFQQKCSCMTI